MTVKVYVLVSAVFDADGTLIPISLTWEDGTVYAIDRVLDIRQAPALKAGAGRPIHGHHKRPSELSVLRTERLDDREQSGSLVCGAQGGMTGNRKKQTV